MVDDRFAVVRLGQVSLTERRSASRFLDSAHDGVASILTPPRDDHLGALGGEHASDLRADPARRTRDDRHLACESIRHARPCLQWVTSRPPRLATRVCPLLCRMQRAPSRRCWSAGSSSGSCGVAPGPTPAPHMPFRAAGDESRPQSPRPCADIGEPRGVCTSGGYGRRHGIGRPTGWGPSVAAAGDALRPGVGAVDDVI